jgi:hypothetical protein
MFKLNVAMPSPLHIVPVHLNGLQTVGLLRVDQNDVVRKENIWLPHRQDDFMIHMFVHSCVVVYLYLHGFGCMCIG